MYYWLVSTYVVCERLSVMHEPAGVVEILVQILREYPLFWSSEYPSPKWKLPESPNPRVSEYPPPKMKIVRESKCDSFRIPPPPWKLSESKSESFRIPPPMKIVRVQIWVSEYPKSFRIPPQMKIVTESKSESFRIPPQMKIVTESKSESFRIPPPPKKFGKTSDFKL